MKGYVFLSKNSEKTDKPEFMLMQSNNEFFVLKTWIGVLDNNDSIDKFISWIGDPIEYRFVAKSMEEFNMFVVILSEFIHRMPRDFVRIVKSRFWNIQHEMAYRLKCPKNFTIADFLELYGLSGIVARDQYADCVELHMLANAFFSDKKRTNEIIQKGYLVTIRNELGKMSHEKLFHQALNTYQSLQFKKANERKTYLEVSIDNNPLIIVEGEDPRSALVELLMKKYEKN